MPFFDFTPSDATYICRDDPAADYSRACALVAASSWQRGMTSAILLKFPRPCLATNAGIERAELVLHPWQNRGAEIHPAFHIYSLGTDFSGSLATWERRPKFADFPQVSQPASACGKDEAIHCDITSPVIAWLCGRENHLAIALTAEAGDCLMIHSGCGDQPPRLRLYSCENGAPATPIDGTYPGDCAPEHQEWCSEQTPCGYQEKTFTMHICDDTAFTPAVDIAQARTVTFLIRNDSCSIMEARLQISPNGRDWMDDRQYVSVPADGLAAITPYLFARYIRLGVSSPDASTRAKARVWYQAQTSGCTAIG